ncbi:MAG: hypothetical protein WDA47_03755 [Bacilli bacterium]
MTKVLVTRTGKEATLVGISVEQATVLQDGKEKTVKMVTLTSGYKFVTKTGNTKPINLTVINGWLAEQEREQEQEQKPEPKGGLVTVRDLSQELGYSEKTLRRKLRRMKARKETRIWAWQAESEELKELRKNLKRGA